MAVAVAAAALAMPLTGCMVAESTYLKKAGEVEGLAKNLVELQKKHAELVAGQGKLTAETEKLRADLGAAIKEKERLAADNAELQGVLKARPDALVKTVSQLRRRTADLEEENGKLRQDLESLSKAREEKVRETSRTYEELLKKMEGEISRGQVSISELRGKLTLSLADAAFFEPGKNELKPEGRAVLRKVAEILKGVKEKEIRVEGQIPGSPGERTAPAWELSSARVVNVVRFLRQQGIDPSMLEAAACSEFNPDSGSPGEPVRAGSLPLEIILVPKN